MWATTVFVFTKGGHILSEDGVKPAFELKKKKQSAGPEEIENYDETKEIHI